jgi:hypothetical protein
LLLFREGEGVIIEILKSLVASYDKSKLKLVNQDGNQAGRRQAAGLILFGLPALLGE